MRIRWMEWIKISGLGLVLFLVFLFLTFPFPRLKPLIVKQLQDAIQRSLSTTVSCDLQGFDFHFPLGFQWDRLQCLDLRGQTFLELSEVTITTLPNYQSIKGLIGSGSLEVKANAGFKSAPSHLEVKLDKIPLDKVSSLVSLGISRINPLIRDLQVAGALSGSVDLPLVGYRTKPGSFNLEIRGFRLPPQSTLKTIGLVQGLDFSKSLIKANLSAGKLSISEAAFISDHLSGKAEGSIELAEVIAQSTANLTLKWQVKRSDALMSSQFGALIAMAPCPSPDSEGFCTRKINRLSDLTKAP